VGGANHHPVLCPRSEIAACHRCHSDALYDPEPRRWWGALADAKRACAPKAVVFTRVLEVGQGGRQRFRRQGR